MAVRGLSLSFASGLRKTCCQSSVRLLRTNKKIQFEEFNEDPDFKGIYSSNEQIERSQFGVIRRDRDNKPNYHGEFESQAPKEPELHFDAPTPTKSSLKVAEKLNGGQAISRTEWPKKKEKQNWKGVERDNIEIKSVLRKPMISENDESKLDEVFGSAYEAVKFERKLEDEPVVNSKVDSYGFRVLRAEIKPQIWTMNKEDICKCLLRNILFDSPEVLILDKPYGLSMHGGGKIGMNDPMALTAHLKALAEAFRVEKLYPVHRLDKDVTGVLCIAKNKEIADTIKAMFKARQIKKEYVAITRGVPEIKEGVIERHLALGTVEARDRMVIVPEAEPGSNISLPKFKKVFPAVTRYKVISNTNFAAFVRLLPETGYKHQLRVHLGFGLRCPILGDHKYTSFQKIAPQKLPGEMLDKLRVRQQKVREIPLHLHSRHIVIPGILGGGRNLIVKSSIPTHFKRNLARLKLEERS